MQLGAYCATLEARGEVVGGRKSRTPTPANTRLNFGRFVFGANTVALPVWEVALLHVDRSPSFLQLTQRESHGTTKIRGGNNQGYGTYSCGSAQGHC